MSAEREIEARLADLSAHIENVISNYLRGQYDTIDEYNAAAGEQAEPYRVLVVFDYPAGFSDAAAQRLLSLMENGPRCGLHTIVVADEVRQQPRDLSLSRLRQGQHRMTWKDHKVNLTLPWPTYATGTLLDVAPVLDGPDAGSPPPVPFDIVPDESPPITFDQDGAPVSPAAKLLVKVGEASRTVGTEAVTLDRLLPVLNRMITTGRNPTIPQLRSGAAPAG